MAFISVMATSKTNVMNKENNQDQFLRFIDIKVYYMIFTYLSSLRFLSVNRTVVSTHLVILKHLITDIV